MLKILSFSILILVSYCGACSRRSQNKVKKDEILSIDERLRLEAEAEATRKAEEERLRPETEEAAREAEEQRVRLEAEAAARKAEEERLRLEAEDEAARQAEEERLRLPAEAARQAEEERLRLEAAEAVRQQEEESLRLVEEARRKAEEDRLRIEQEERPRQSRKRAFEPFEANSEDESTGGSSASTDESSGTDSKESAKNKLRRAVKKIRAIKNIQNSTKLYADEGNMELMAVAKKKEDGSEELEIDYAVVANMKKNDGTAETMQFPVINTEPQPWWPGYAEWCKSRGQEKVLKMPKKFWVKTGIALGVGVPLGMGLAAAHVPILAYGAIHLGVGVTRGSIMDMMEKGKVEHFHAKVLGHTIPFGHIGGEVVQYLSQEVFGQEAGMSLAEKVSEGVVEFATHGAADCKTHDFGFWLEERLLGGKARRKN